jgi:hypothetical protein
MPSSSAFRAFSIQIVFSKKTTYTIDSKGFIDLSKVLCRTAVLDAVETGVVEPKTELVSA